MENLNTSLMFVIEDTLQEHSVPDLLLGKTPEGKDLFVKGLFPTQEMADSLAAFMGQQSGDEGRFKVSMAEIWKPTDLELYVRQRIRDNEASKNTPKLILPSGL